MMYIVEAIEEDMDFGCEEKPEGTPVMAVVTLKDKDGSRLKIRTSDQYLYDQNINEGDCVMLSPYGDIIKAHDVHDELFDICDNNGVATGKAVARSIAHRDGITHRTAHIWITREHNGKTQILLQKRSMNKDSFPGMYDTSSAGHIQAGDEPLESAVRELREELGIAAKPSKLKFAGNFHVHYALEFHGSMFRDDEVVFVYVYDAPVDIRDIVVQEEELERVEWFDLAEVYNDCRNNIRDRFCVPTEGLEVLKNYLEGNK